MHYACINVYFWQFSWSSLHLANVASVGPCCEVGRTEGTTKNFAHMQVYCLFIIH